MPNPRDEYDCPKPIMTIAFLSVGDDVATGVGGGGGGECYPSLANEKGNLLEVSGKDFHLLIKEKASRRVSPFAPNSFQTGRRASAW